jgi:ribosomal protein S18 acetylase RimI-like enzyme
MQIIRIDIARINLVIDLFDKYRVFYKQPPDIERATTFLTERLKNNESIIFAALAEKDGMQIPVGFTQLYPAYSSVRTIRNWILNDLYVEPDYRKQGIGEALIRTAMRFAQEKGAKYVQLETAVNNFTAQKLY